MSHKFRCLLYVAAAAKWHGMLPPSVEYRVNRVMSTTTVVAARRVRCRELSRACALQMLALSEGKTPVWGMGGTRVFSGYACCVDYEQLPEAVRELWFENATRAGSTLSAVSEDDFTIVTKADGSVTVSCGSAIATGSTGQGAQWGLIVMLYIVVGVVVFLLSKLSS